MWACDYGAIEGSDNAIRSLPQHSIFIDIHHIHQTRFFHFLPVANLCGRKLFLKLIFLCLHSLKDPKESKRAIANGTAGRLLVGFEVKLPEY